MEWKTSISNHAELLTALNSCVDTLSMTLDGDPDVIFVFSTIHHVAYWSVIGPVILERFPEARIVGCSGGGVIGGGYEVEQTPALALTAAVMPDVNIEVFHIDAEERPGGVATSADWMNWLGLESTPENLILLPDPFSFDVQSACKDLELAFPEATIMGGLASGGSSPESHGLFIDGDVHRQGAVGLALSGNVVMDPVVAQGCRPIGPPCFVTRCERNILFELDGHTALSVLQEVCKGLEPHDLSLAQKALSIGLIHDPENCRYQQGDFLVRTLLGAMPDAGALAVGTVLEQGSVVQFQVRDARSAWEELDAILARHAMLRQRPHGALMFSCLGRGETLFGEPGHDSKVIENHLGPVPIGGFFCNGEIGPVSGRTWVHGFTSAIAFFRPAFET